jgi:hypothetical protein
MSQDHLFWVSSEWRDSKLKLNFSRRYEGPFAHCSQIGEYYLWPPRKIQMPFPWHENKCRNCEVLFQLYDEFGALILGRSRREENKGHS